MTAPRARAPRRDTARSDASRSARADSSSASARAEIDATHQTIPWSETFCELVD